MRKYWLLLAILLTTLAGTAQNKASVKGTIIDSTDRKPIELVTIAILSVKDTTSTLLSYTITDKNGEFGLRNLPANVPLKIFISNVAYKPFRKNFSLKPGAEFDMGQIILATNQLKEVNIKGDRPPIVIRKDTIEFNAEAFKVKPNAVVQDLLKKLPGVQVEMNGAIMVRGKNVSKVLVGGREFFSRDYRIATQNIDVELVDKIQVYDDREGDPLHLRRASELDKVINIKLKKAIKKSTFGKVYAGGGTNNRYTAGGLVNTFRDTLQISALALGNNLNNTSFSYSDLDQMGGFGRGGSDAFFRGGMNTSDGGGLGNIDNSSGVGGFIGFNGVNRQSTGSGGVNVNTDYGKKLKMNLAYYYSHTNTESNITSNSRRFLGDTTITSIGKTLNMQREDKHNITSLFQYKPNDTTELEYRPAFAYTNNLARNSYTGNSFNNFVPNLSRSSSANTDNGRSFEFRHGLTYKHQLKKKGEAIKLSHLLSIEPRNSENRSADTSVSFAPGLSPYQINRNDVSTNNSFFANANLTYLYPVSKKLRTSISVTSEYARNKNYNLIYDQNTATEQYDVFVPTLSNMLIRNSWTQTVEPTLVYDLIKDVKLTLGATGQLLNINNQFGRGIANIDQKFVNVLPSAAIDVGDFTLNYNEELITPDIYQLRPYTLTYSPQSSESGNPYLKPTKRRSFRAGYNNYYDKSQISVNASAHYTTEKNTIVRYQTLDAVGNNSSAPINVNGKYSMGVSGGVDKSFNGWEDVDLRLITRFSANRNRLYFQLNKEDGLQHNNNLTLNQKVSFSYKDLIEFEQGYKFSVIKTNYTGINFADLSYVTHVTNSHLIFNWPKRVTLESTYAYVYNPRVGAGLNRSANLLNLSVARRFMKKERAEIKLSCYDLLNQNVSQYRFTEANSVHDMQWLTLNRYFLLTLQFKFNKTETK